MISLDELTKDWERDGVWKIAPAGLAWIKAGAHIAIGERATIGEGATIGEWAAIGERATIGERAAIGEEAAIGDGARIGAWARIGEGARIGEWARIGERAAIGPKSSDAVDLGWADGYRKCVAQVDGVAYIGAGCRWFTLDSAIAHWAAAPAGTRDLTRCLLQSASHIAGLRGWRTS